MKTIGQEYENILPAWVYVTVSGYEAGYDVPVQLRYSRRLSPASAQQLALAFGCARVAPPGRWGRDG
jgi:hypothetical protein